MSPDLLTFLLIAIGIALVSGRVTRWMIGYAGRIGLQDIPNQRSSHTVPVPRGGGLAIVACFAASLLIFLANRWIDSTWILSVFVGGIAVATVGWLDDRYTLSAKVRFLVHLGAAGLVSVAVFSSHVSVRALFFELTPAYLVIPFSVLFIAWVTNLFNFMDGIDGIAGSEAIAVAGASALFCVAQGDLPLAGLYLFVAASVLGFLVFNWPPARIFMGDVGSGFLGFCFASLALMGESSRTLPLSASLILLGTFIVDATYTLIRRLFEGQRVYEAHRDHAYQHLVQMGFAHKRVTLIYAGVNLLWLAPLAWASVQYPERAGMLVVVAYMPVCLVNFCTKAGVKWASRPAAVRASGTTHAARSAC